MADMVLCGHAPRNGDFRSSTSVRIRCRTDANRLHPRLPSQRYLRPSSCPFRWGSQDSQAGSTNGCTYDGRMRAVSHKACCIERWLSPSRLAFYRMSGRALLNRNGTVGQRGRYMGSMDQYDRSHYKNVHIPQAVSHMVRCMLGRDLYRPSG